VAVRAGREGRALTVWGGPVLAGRGRGGGGGFVRPSNAPPADALARLEEKWPFVLYVAETADPIWRRLCLRQADALVLVARADAFQDGLAAPAPWSEVGLKGAAPMPKLEHLVLVHPATVRPGAARAWQEMR